MLTVAVVLDALLEGQAEGDAGAPDAVAEVLDPRELHSGRSVDEAWRVPAATGRFLERESAHGLWFAGSLHS